MALNYSIRPLFPAHLSEDNLVSPMRIANGYLVEGIPERSRDGFAHQWPSSRELQDWGDNMDWETVLPADPFGMDIDMNISSTVTAITGLLESLEYGARGRSEVGVSKGDCSFFAELNFLFSKAMDFHPFPGTKKVDDKIFVADTADTRLCQELGHPFCDGGLNFVCTMDLNENSPKDDEIICEELCHSLGGGLNFACTIERWENHHKDEEILMADKIDEPFFEKELGNPFCDGGFNFACTTDRHENHQKDDEILMADTIDEPFCEELGSAFCDNGFRFACAMDMNEDNEKANGVASDPNDGEPYAALSFSDADDGKPCLALSASAPGVGEPHEALGYTLCHLVMPDPLSVCHLLPVRDLLSVERVCKSMHDLVSEACFWRNVHIDQPLNDRITDDILIQITSRSQGRLRCLSLVECQKITDDGLKRILESNLSLTKLSVPGCTRLSIDGILSCLRAFKSVAKTGIKYLRIGGLYGVTQEHFDELMSLLGIPNHAQANRNKPLFYHRGNFYLSCEDERPIDIETCPRCQKLRLVYDCPAESCQGKEHATQSCRACTLCIPRCVQCGKCVTNGEYVENFCLEFLCSVCWKQSSRCQERQDTQPSPSHHAVHLEPVSSFNG